MRCLFSIFLFVLFCSGDLLAAKVHGKIYDSQSKETLVGATITYSSGKGTTSDSKGLYKLDLEPGKWKLTIMFVGYQTETRQLNLTVLDSVHLDIGLVAVINEIDNVVVTAGKVEQKLSELTVSLTLIKPYYLKNNHIVDAEELLNRTPGIEVLDGQASIRGGSGFSYGAGSRVMALVDGLPIISADAGNIKWHSLPLENLSQIEIIKGASSVIYGSSALNGVINFRTADAEKNPVTKYFTETGIYTSPSRIEWKWWDTPRVYSNSSVSHSQKIGHTDVGISGNLVLENGYRRLEADNHGRVSLRLKHYNQNIDGLVYGLNVNQSLIRKVGFIIWENAETGALKQNESTANLLNGYTLSVDPFIGFKQNEKTNHDFRIRFLNSTNNYPYDGQTNSQSISFYSEYQFQHRIHKIALLNFGMSENYSTILSNFYGDHSLLNLAGYSQVDIETTKKLNLVAGMRVEQNIQDGEAAKFVPIFRTGLNYRLANYSFLRASFGQGYRYPSIAEKYASTSLGSVKIFPSPSILPESGWNTELGMKQGIRFGNLNGIVDIAAFFTQNKEMIEYVFGLYQDPITKAFDVGFMAVNIENSRVYGTELEFNLNYSSSNFNHTLSGGYLFIYPIEYNGFTGKNTDNYLKYRRKQSANLDWTIMYRKFDFGLSLIAKSKMLDIDNVFLNEFTREDILPGFYDYWNQNNKGYLLTNCTFAYRKTDHLKISLAVKNLFNVEYMGRPGDIMPHRNISIRISGSF